MSNYELVFDEVILRQLKKAERNKHLQSMLSKMLDKIELSGPNAGDLLDSRLRIYEIKMKRPPIRLYFKHNIQTNEIYVFEFEMKTSEKKQQETINRIKERSEP